MKKKKETRKRCEHLVVWSLAISVRPAAMNEWSTKKKYGYRARRSLSFIDYEAVRTGHVLFGGRNNEVHLLGIILSSYIPYEGIHTRLVHMHRSFAEHIFCELKIKSFFCFGLFSYTIEIKKKDVFYLGKNGKEH